MTGKEPDYDSLQEMLDHSRSPRTVPFRVIASALGEPIMVHWTEPSSGQWKLVPCQGLSCGPCWAKNKRRPVGIYTAIYRDKPTELVFIRVYRQLLDLMQRHPGRRCFLRIGEGLNTEYVLGPEFVIQRELNEVL